MVVEEHLAEACNSTLDGWADPFLTSNSNNCYLWGNLLVIANRGR